MEKRSVIIGISIIVGFLILGLSIIYTFKDKNIEGVNMLNNNRYEIVTPNDVNIIIFDKETGRYWRKFIEPNQGPPEWTEESINFLND